MSDTTSWSAEEEEKRRGGEGETGFGNFSPSPSLPLSLSSLIAAAWTAAIACALATALLPLPTAALLLGLVFAVVLALVEPVFGLYWVLLSIPVQELVHLPGGLSYTQAAMLLATGAWGLRVLAHPEQRVVKGRLFPLWCALLWALLLSTSFTPYVRTEGVKETLRWAEAFLVWLIAVNTLRRRWQLVGMVVCLLLPPAADAAIGLAQSFSGAGPLSFRIASGQTFLRAYGTIGQPNSFAGYMNMAWPLALALAVGATTALWRTTRRPPTTDHRPPTADRRPPTADRRPPTAEGETGRGGEKEKDIAVPHPPSSILHPPSSILSILYPLSSILGSSFLALLLLAALGASFSRGAWVGAVVGGLGMALALGRRAARWTVGLVVAGALALALGGAGLLPEAFATRLLSIPRSLSFFDVSATPVTPENFARVERMAHIQAGWRMFRAYPLTGVGPGNYTPAYPDFAIPPWYGSRGHAHNYYLHMAAEGGIAGLAAYLALIVAVAYQAVATLRSTDRTLWHSTAVGCCGIIAAVAGHNLFENLHVLGMGIHLGAVWGLLCALGRQDDTMTR